MSPKTRRNSANNKQGIAGAGTSTRRTIRRTTSTPTRCSARLNRASGSTGLTVTPGSSNTPSAVEEERGTPPMRSENDSAEISIIDLASPSPRPIRRAHELQPLEVDLTCDVDEEVFVLSVNPFRRDHNLPVVLGASPPRVRSTGRTRCPVPQVNKESAAVVQQPTQMSASSAEPQGQDNSRGIYCPVCLDSLAQIKASNNQMHSTMCGHLFCGPCIRRVLASTKQCPTCRQPQKLQKTHPVFI